MTKLPAIRVALLLGLVFAAPLGVGGQSLAPTGTLRVSFLGTNPVQGRVDPKTGEVTGPVVDLTLELARRLGLPFTIIPVANPAALIESIKTRSADVGFLAYDAARALEVEFSDPYALMGSAYLVRADSPIMRSGDVDKAGVKIGTVTGQSQQLYVSEHVKNARISMMPVTPPHEALVGMLLSGEIDAFAANRQRMEEAAATSAKVRVLSDNFSAVGQALVVEKGDAARRDLLNRFVADILASGLVKSSIARARLVGVEVAPIQKR